MRLYAGLPLQFWADAVNTAVYLINRGPSRTLDGGILEEAWIGKQVKYSFLRNFGCEEFVHIDKDDRTNLEDKSKKYTFIRYGVDDFGYCLWDFENHKIIKSRDVVFNENVMYKDQLQGKKVENKKIIRSRDVVFNEKKVTNIGFRESKRKRKTRSTHCLMK